MDTVRVDIVYRPLRIAWAIHSSDRESLRRAVRLTHTMRGGRYNPIVLVDCLEEARELVEVFRADIVWPVGTAKEVADFPGMFPHLIDPLHGSLFLRHGNAPGRAHVLDMQNALVHWRNTPDWKEVDERGIRTFVWDDDDPLGDIFLMRYGRYPNADEIGIDYLDVLGKATLAIQERIDKRQPLPQVVMEHPSIAYLSWSGLERHHTVRSGWDYPGFFFGDASRVDDLVAFWNRRAADIELMFVDPQHESRYAIIRPLFEQRLRNNLSYRQEHERSPAVWARPEIMDEGVKFFGGAGLTACRVVDGEWNGLNIRPPMMALGSDSALGVVGRDGDKPRVSFALTNKPFSDDVWFHNQHLVASIVMLGGLYGDDHHTYRLPYVPELNELFARTMHFEYDMLRVEPERTGLIIRTTDYDTFLSAMPVGQLIEKIFDQAGLRSRLSSGGLIGRQLISRVGGVRGGRVFKIPGVRRLIKTHGPSGSFSRSAALGLIGGNDPDNPGARFADHEGLYIEPREIGDKLTPAMVFKYLVGKGLFRIGLDLVCPTCQLTSWVALDGVKQKVTCDLCGADYDATRQLVDADFRYRRTGVLGLEKNTQGAVPVALVLEQLTRNLWDARHGFYGPSYDLEANDGVNLPTCEVDFVMVLPRTYPNKADMILGEVKDRTQINANDVENLRQIADAISDHRFEVFIALVKLGTFSADEIALAKTLNGPYRRRAILLTARELEPYDILERTKKETGQNLRYGGTPEELANVTHQLYFA
jgi:hypothetical protein